MCSRSRDRLLLIFSYYRNETPMKTKTVNININRNRKRYGIMAFLFDLILVCITGGLWLIWIFVREMRNR